ncbi:hypothetical protein [Pseudooceanicola atlanticus]|uniref:hypothetical protein n=1 Tax=Pseudooceanicola atlanticus TaxID=1461694 RepID=UPI00235362DC|nr:hypothetical protein [Pseudooceanicola atlanticus]
MPDRDEKGRFLVGHGQPGPGRPPIYDEALNTRAYQLALAGKTDEQIAEIFSIHVSTLYHWKSLYPAFSEAFKNGREIADGEAAHAAHIAINGGIVREQRVYRDAQGNILKTIETTKEVPPDPSAAMKWLELRARGLWARKTEEPRPDDPNAITDVRNLSDEELAERRAQLAARRAAEKE